MSKTQETVVPVNPADLPADALIPYAAFAHLMPHTNRRMVEDNAKAGRFIAGVRITPRKPMVWRAGAVAAWLAERTACLGAAK